MNKSEFFLAVDSLIILNKLNRELFYDKIKHIGDISFANEFGTVHVNCGRRIGKTEYIKSRATENDLVIVFNQHVKQTIFNGCKATIACAFEFKDKKSIEKFIEKNDLSKFKSIFIDEPELVFKDINKEDLYALLADKNKTFILLGA